MFFRPFVFVLLLSFITQSIAISFPRLAVAQESLPRPLPLAKLDQSPEDQPCNSALGGTIAIIPRYVGHVFGVPLMVETLKKDPIFRSNMWRQWKTGITNTVIGSYLASILSWTIEMSAGYPRPFPLPFSAEFVFRTLKAYFGYNGTNMVRYPINNFKMMFNEEKYWTTVFYSGLWYTIFDSVVNFAQGNLNALASHFDFGPKLFGAPPSDPKWVLNMFVFSLLWPLFSQFMSNNVIYPKVMDQQLSPKELEDLQKTPRDLERFLKKPRTIIETAAEKKAKLKEKIRLADSRLARGTDSKAYRKKVKLVRRRAAITLENLPRTITKAKFQKYWIERLTEGVGPNDPIPESRLREYNRQFNWKNKLATFGMITAYFVAMWALLGSPKEFAAGNLKPIPWLVEHPNQSAVFSTILVPLFLAIRWLDFNGKEVDKELLRDN